MDYQTEKGKGFTYLLGGSPVTDRDELEYCNRLHIPPAWQDVKLPNC
jgi:DNA topoisomerase IB